MRSGFVEACAKQQDAFPQITTPVCPLCDVWQASLTVVAPLSKMTVHQQSRISHRMQKTWLAKSSSSLMLSVKRPHLYTRAGSDSFLILYQLSSIIPEIKRKVQADTYVPRHRWSYRQTRRPHVGRCGMLNCDTFANLSTTFLHYMQTAFGSKQQEVGLELKLWGSVMNNYQPAVF